MDTDPRIVDLTNLRQIADGDADFVRELTEIFLVEAVKLISELRNAFGAGDAKTVEHRAHSVKGSSANIGAQALREIAFRLECLGREGDLTKVPDALTELDQEFEKVRTHLEAAILAD